MDSKEPQVNQQLHLWGCDEADQQIPAVACAACCRETSTLEAQERVHPDSPGPADDSEADDWGGDEVTDAMMYDGMRSWQEIEADEVCIPLYGQI